MAKRRAEHSPFVGFFESDVDTLELPLNFFRDIVLAKTPKEDELVDCDFALHLHDKYENSRSIAAWRETQKKLRDMKATFSSSAYVDRGEFHAAVDEYGSLLKMKWLEMSSADFDKFMQSAVLVTRLRGDTQMETLPQIFERTRQTQVWHARISALLDSHKHTYDQRLQYRSDRLWTLARLDFGDPSYAYKSAFWSTLTIYALSSKTFLAFHLHPDDKLMRKFQDTILKLQLY